MVKKPASKASGEKDTSGAFFSNLKKKGSMLKKIGKEEAPAGYTTVEDQVEAFGLKPEKKVTTTAKCVGARCGVDKNKNDFVSFNFVCTGSIGKGQTPGKYIELCERGNRTEEQQFKEMIFTLQRMGYDTSDLDSDNLKELLEQIKTDKPHVSITLSGYRKADKSVGIDLRVNRLIDDEEVEDEEEEDEEDTEVEEEEESDDEEESSDDEEEESDDESDDEEEEEEEDDLEDPKSWVGQKATVKTSKMPKACKVTLTSYDAKKKTFKAQNAKKETLTIKLDEVQEVH